MEAACRGAKGGGGTTVGILPGTDRGEANEFVDVAIPTGLGEARNALVVRAADALIAVGGGYGTLSEIALALKAGKRVVGLGSLGDRRRRAGGRSGGGRRGRPGGAPHLDSAPILAGQSDTPYLDALKAYAARNPGRFHVPGHKGGAGADPGLVDGDRERGARARHPGADATGSTWARSPLRSRRRSGWRPRRGARPGRGGS